MAALGMLLIPASAHAASGGGATVAAAPTPAPVATSTTSTSTPAPGTSLQTTALKLSRTQTRSVQRRLRLRADGVLGSGTRAALKRYQRTKRLTITGKPNVETLRALGLKLADRFQARLEAQAASVPADPAAVTLPPATLPGAAGALEAARTRIGDPYVSGGTKPGGFDCSGLMVWAFAQVGITLLRTSFQQYREGVAIEKAQIQAGDLVFFDSAGSGASHVGIATGPTKVISATTHGVMEHSIASGYWASHYVGARRLTA